MEHHHQAALISSWEQEQHYHFTRALDGLLPGTITPRKLKHVLDVNCTNGKWAIDLALAYPGIHVTGLGPIIEQARLSAKAARLDRVQFYQTDLRKPFPLANQGVDLVHLLFYKPLLRASEWPAVLQECKRVLVPGGTINLVAFTFGPGSSKAYQQLRAAEQRLLITLGFTFSDKPGAASPGVHLCDLLRQADFGTITYHLYSVNLGGLNNPSGRSCYQLFLSDLSKQKHLFIEQEVLKSKAFDALIEQGQQDALAMDFCATGVLTSALAIKR